MKDKITLQQISREQLETLSKSDLIHLFLGEQDLRAQAESWARAVEEEAYRIGELYIRVRNRIFNPKSEKSKKLEPKPKKDKKKPEKRNLQPSERYPDAIIIEQDIELDPAPPCRSCGVRLEDSGLVESVEVLSVIPKQYIIKRQNHHKYCCRKCHGDFKTSPAIPRIKPGSAYDDAIIIDVSMSKYCDLIPIERYSQMAKRSGFPGIPPQSLIELTHYLADFLDPVYSLIREEVLKSELLYADETTHRMLEGDPKKTWFLWGFSTESASYFECHDTRSGDVASELLMSAECIFLMSDVYAGYNKATKQCNVARAERGVPLLENIYCNAHARRKFKELEEQSETCKIFVSKYENIYRELKISKELDPIAQSESRRYIKTIFLEIYQEGTALLDSISSKSAEAQAINYFVKNFAGLTRFLDFDKLPIDNNHQERLLRKSVVGRKTWLGTHSRRGAETAAKLMTIVETCHLNRINPREYVAQVVKAMLRGQSPYTPAQSENLTDSSV
jgi:transposase